VSEANLRNQLARLTPAALHNTLVQQIKTTQDAFDAAQEELRATKQREQELQTEYARLQGRIRATIDLETLAELEIEAKRQDEVISKVAKHRRKVEDRIKAARKKLAEMRQYIEALPQRLVAAKSNARVTEDQIARAEEVVEYYKQRLREHQAEVARLQDEIESTASLRNLL
jgi:chromosome segregation ATPase